MRIYTISVMTIVLIWFLFPTGCALKDANDRAPISPGTQTVPITEAKMPWQSEWDKTEQLAKKEGRLVIWGPPSATLKQALITKFQKVYPGVTMEYSSLTGSQVAPKIVAERNAGIFAADLHIGGAPTMVFVLKTFAIPLEELIILPEVKDGKNWMGGKMNFVDNEGKFVLELSVQAKPAIAYNPNLLDIAKIGEISYWDLTRPEWQGKIMWSDPRIPGSGSGIIWFAWATSSLGKDWIKAIAKNEVVLSRDTRQMLEWVGRGKYPLLIGPSDLEALELIENGLPIKLHYTMKEGRIASSGYGHIMALDRMPHPNAAKVFVNWFLSREGQLVWSQETKYTSRRLDVPTSHLPSESIISPGVKYSCLSSERVYREQADAIKFATDVFGK